MRRLLLSLLFLPALTYGCGQSDATTAAVTSAPAESSPPPAQARALEGNWGGYFRAGAAGQREGLEFRLSPRGQGRGWLFRGSRSLAGGRATGVQQGEEVQLRVQLRENQGTAEVTGRLGTDGRIRGTWRHSPSGETGPIELERAPADRHRSRTAPAAPSGIGPNYYGLQASVVTPPGNTTMYYGLGTSDAQGTFSVTSGPAVGDDHVGPTGNTAVQCLYFETEWITIDFYDPQADLIEISEIGSIEVLFPPLLNIYANPDPSKAVLVNGSNLSTSYLYIQGDEQQVSSIALQIVGEQQCYDNESVPGIQCMEETNPFYTSVTVSNAPDGLSGTYNNLLLPVNIVTIIQRAWGASPTIN